MVRRVQTWDDSKIRIYASVNFLAGRSWSRESCATSHSALFLEGVEDGHGAPRRDNEFELRASELVGAFEKLKRTSIEKRRISVLLRSNSRNEGYPRTAGSIRSF